MISDLQHLFYQFLTFIPCPHAISHNGFRVSSYLKKQKKKGAYTYYIMENEYFCRMLIRAAQAAPSVGYGMSQRPPTLHKDVIIISRQWQHAKNTNS